MTADDLAWIAGALIGLVGGTFIVRHYVRRPRAETVDPRCRHVDGAGHRCVRMSGHLDDHQVLSVYKQSEDRE